MELKIAFFIIVVSVSNVLAIPTYSQVAKVSLDMENRSLEQVMDEIERQSEFYFIFNQKQIDVNRVVDIQAENKLITDILPELFKGTNVNYVVMDRKILLTTDPLDNNLLAMASMTKPQQNKVAGVVTARDGSPLAGVNVVITGTTVGALTGADGKYSLEIPKGSKSLTFTFIGMESQQINIGTSTQINVTMVESEIGLKEVVVTGVGVATSKRDLAFSVEAISAKDLPTVSTSSIDQSLVGKIPGAQISSVNGTPGANLNILLRGINSVSAGTLPMILLDGVQLSATNLNSVDLSTIGKVEVVEGAASATIYGAQGANGVIQLFTKRGENTGKVNVDISSSYAMSSYLNCGNVNRATLHGFNTDAQNNVVDASGNPLVFDPEKGYTQSLIWSSSDPTVLDNKPYNANLKYYDGLKMLFQSAPTTNNSITFSGGTDKLDAALTLSNNHQVDNLKDNGYLDRTNLTTNIGFELAKNLNIRSISQVIFTKSTIHGDLNGNSEILDMFMSRPFANYAYTDPDGNHLVSFGGSSVGTIGGDPFYGLQYRIVNDKKTDFVQSFDLNYKPLKFLELDAKYGINYQKYVNGLTYLDQSQNKSVIFYNTWLSSQNGANPTGEFLNDIGTTMFQNLTASAIVHLDFQKDLNLNIPLVSITQGGYDFRTSNYNDYSVSGIGLPKYAQYTLSDLTSYRVIGAQTTIFTTYGYLVTERLNYGSYGSISGGFRSDWSSAFGAGSKPFTFPRADAYIRPSAFDFWSGIKKVLPEFKIRAAFGEAGIQPGPYQRYVTLDPTQLAGKVVFTEPTAGTNPDLNVEVSKELEIGTEMTFSVNNGEWLKKIDFSLTYWKRSTDNSIWPLDVAPSTGMGSVLNNSFGLKSDGVQASLNVPVLTAKNFTWNFTTNFGHQETIITSVKNGMSIIVSTSASGLSGILLEPGYKIGQTFGYLALHSVTAIDATTGQPFIPVAQQSAYSVASNGWVVNTATKVPFFTTKQYPFGDPNPKFNSSFINDFAYKDFVSVSMQWDWIYGSHLYNQTREWMMRDGIGSDCDVPITIGGQTGAWAAYYRGLYANVTRDGTKSIFYEDASFARLRNLAVAFDLAKVFHLKSIRKLQLVLSGHNLITVTKYRGMDPEASSGTTNSSFDRGVDCMSMPSLKTYQVGINLGF